ncbi:TPA: DUF2569 family protein [Raoultella planticola]
MNTSNSINGWLYFPALGLIIACITVTLNLLAIARLFLFKLLNGEPISIPLAGYLLTGGVIDLGLLYFATFCFFRRKKAAKRAMIAYYCWSFLLNGSLILFSWVYLGMAAEIKEIGLLLSICVGLFVWTPYFLFSKRIARVFYKE